MNMQDLISKLKTIAEAPVDNARAQYDKFKADDARAAAEEQVRKISSIPLNQIGRLQNVIDPKSGIIYYGEAGEDSSRGTARAYPYDFYQRGQEKDFFNMLKTAGLEVIPVPQKSLFGSFNVAGVQPEKLAQILADIKPVTSDDGQGGLASPCAEKIAKLNALLKKLEAAKKGDAGQGGKVADDDVLKRLGKVGVPVQAFEGTELSIEKALLLEFGYQELDEYSLKDFGQDASDLASGALSGVTLGTSDNAIAGARSLIKGTKYKDELEKELAAAKAASERSPWLYGGGELAGAVLAPIPGGLVGNVAARGAKALGAGSKVAKAADITGQVGSNIAASVAAKSAIDAHNANVLGKDGQGGKTQGDPKVYALQGKLIAAGAKIKQDGIMGPATQAAMKKFPNVKESVAETMSSLRTRLAMLEQENVEEGFWDKAFGKLIGKGGDDAAKAAEKITPPITAKPVTVPGSAGKAADDAAGAAAKVVDDIPIGKAFLDSQGTTWVKRAGYWEPVAGPLKGAKNQVGKKSNPEFYAKLEKEAGGGGAAPVAKPKETPPAKPAETPPAKPAETPPAGGAGGGAGGKVLTAAEKEEAAAIRALDPAARKSWIKRNPKKAIAFGAVALGLTAYALSRILAGDDEAPTGDDGQGPSPAPTPAPTPGPTPAPVAVDTTAIENEIGQLMSDLAQQPECQKELAAARAELARIKGDANIGSLDKLKEDELETLLKLLK